MLDFPRSSHIYMPLVSLYNTCACTCSQSAYNTWIVQYLFPCRQGERRGEVKWGHGHWSRQGQIPNGERDFNTTDSICFPTQYNDCHCVQFEESNPSCTSYRQDAAVLYTLQHWTDPAVEGQAKENQVAWPHPLYLPLYQNTYPFSLVSWLIYGDN